MPRMNRLSIEYPAVRWLQEEGANWIGESMRWPVFVGLWEPRVTEDGHGRIACH